MVGVAVLSIIILYIIDVSQTKQAIRRRYCRLALDDDRAHANEWLRAVWLDLHLSSGEIRKSLGWLYWLPNPLFPFIWYRVGLPATHPSLHVEEYSAEEPGV